jgi:ubiquinone/menaquinone biosynthesis C-methylase UbiE
MMRLWGRQGRRWRRFLADQLDLQPGNSVLDVGSGTGQLAVELARRVVPGGSVEGVDPAEEMVAEAAKVTKPLGLPVRFQVGSAQRLPVGANAVDAVTCTLAVHHIADSDRLLAVQEMLRVLRPGGQLLIADLQSPGTGARHFLMRRLVGHAIAERPLDQAQELMLSAGFTDVNRSETPVAWIGHVVGTKA